MRRWLLILGLPMAIAAAQDRDTFTSSYPATARAIPALRARLDEVAARTRVMFYREAAADRRLRAAGRRESPPWRESIDWLLVTETPRFVSLSANHYRFSVGAHGNVTFAALIWDKALGREVRLGEVFESRAALSAAIRRPFCAALDSEREDRRGSVIDQAHRDWSERCLDPAEGAIVLGSSDRRRIDRVGVLVAPYAAGPFSEGPYEITLPVTSAVFAIVRPAYRDAVAVGR